MTPPKPTRYQALLEENRVLRDILAQRERRLETMCEYASGRALHRWIEAQLNDPKRKL